MFSLALILALAVPAFAESVQVTDFAGLNNSVDPAIIGQGETPDSLNVELNRQGKGIRKRDGIVGFLTGYSTYTTTSLFAFKNQSGNEVILFTNGPHVFRSINNATPVALTTVTADARLYCSNSQGTAYCFTSSNDVPWKYDGTTRTDLKTLSYPNGKFNVFTQDRQLVAGTTDFLNRLHISKSASVEDYSGGSDIVSSWTEDIGTAGDRITFLGYLNGRVIVGKEFSIVGFNLTDQFNSVMYGISSDVGLIGPESAIQRDGMIYFKGSDQDFYAIDGSPGGIDKLSVAISSTVASLLAGKTRYNIQTDKADWDAGNLTAAGAGAPMRTDIVAGSVIGSSITLVDTSSTDFNGGTLSGVNVTDSIGSVVVSSTTQRDQFDDGNLTASPAWINTGNDHWTVVSQRARTSNVGLTGDEGQAQMHTTAIAYSSGSWRFTWRYDYTGGTGSIQCLNTSGGTTTPCVNFKFLINSSTDYYGVLAYEGGEVALIKKVSGTKTVLSQHDTGTFNQKVDYGFEVTRSSDGRMHVFLDGVFVASATDTAVSSPNRAGFGGNGTTVSGNSIFSYVDDIYFYQRRGPTASLTSRIFNTTFSTPTPGAFSSTFTFNTGDFGVFFDVRSSTSGNNDLWSDWVATSDTLKFGTTQQYWQYRARFFTNSSTSTPVLSDVSLLAATTGQYVSQCIEPGPGISAWGAYEASVITDGNASITHQIQTGTNCSSLGSFSTISTGTTIPGAVANALKIRQTFSLPSATNTARLDSITVNWTEGAVASATYGAYWNNSLYWSVQTSTGGNNYVLKYDILRPSWWLFDLKAGPLLNFNNQLLMGSALPLGKVYKYSNINPRQAPTSDDGANISAFWKSKNFSGSDPFVENLYDGVNLILRKESGGTVTSTWQANGGDTGSGSYSISLSTGTNAVRSNYKVPIGTRGTFFNVKVSNNSTSPFEILGLRIDYKPQPYRPLP